MSDIDLSACGINFDAPRLLFTNGLHLTVSGVTESAGAYLLLDGTLDECIREFLAKPPAVGTSTKFIPHPRHYWGNEPSAHAFEIFCDLVSPITVACWKLFPARRESRSIRNLFEIDSSRFTMRCDAIGSLLPLPSGAVGSGDHNSVSVH